MRKVAKLRSEGWIQSRSSLIDHEYEREKTGANRLASNRVRTLSSFVSTLVANELLFLGSRIGLKSSFLRIRCAFLVVYFKNTLLFRCFAYSTTKNKLKKCNCNNTIDDPFVNFY